MVNHYKELKVWQKSFSQCMDVYQATISFPEWERYCLTSQIRRSAVLVPSFIAAGHGKKTIREYIHSLYTAFGSNCELETKLLLAVDLGYLNFEEKEKLKETLREVGIMLRALIGYLERRA